MIEDIYEPLIRYRDEFREKFSRLTKEKFQELLEKSQVDWEENRRLNQKIAATNAELESFKNKK